MPPLVTTREMETISRGPTFGDFVTIRTEASMQDVTVARLQSTRVQTTLFPHLLNVMYCVRVSLWTNFHYKSATRKSENFYKIVHNKPVLRNVFLNEFLVFYKYELEH